MTPTYGRIAECNVTAPPRESGLAYTAALTAQIAAADLTRPIEIRQGATDD